MSYLLRVVLGRAGDPRLRKEWATTGLNERLDLEAIYRAMRGHDGNVRSYMVLDANVLDLSQTLFYYDKDLSFSKRRSGFMSIYPAAEFLALRLLFLHKIEKGEKIRLGPLVKHIARLKDPRNTPAPAWLRDSGLTPQEGKLIRECILRQPSLTEYLKDPFLVAALHAVGLLHLDPWTRGRLKAARYARVPCARAPRFRETDRVRVAVLTSLTRQFRKGEGGCGFEPTEHLSTLVARLEKGIVGTAADLILEAIPGKKTPGALRRAGQEVRRRVAFAVQDHRPLVVYPENAEQVIRDVCPDADFVVILRGKRAYLAMHVDPQRDIYPAVNRLYVDMSDIEYNTAQDAYEEVARFIVSRLGKMKHREDTPEVREALYRSKPRRDAFR